MSDVLKHITTISFDGDGTLWDHESAMRQALAATLEELCRYVIDVPEWLDVERMIAIRQEVGHELQHLDLGLDDVRHLAFRRTLEAIEHPDPALASYLMMYYQRKRMETLALFPDALAVLDALGSRYCLGVISNGTTNPETMKLDGRFSFVLMGEDLGLLKPGPQVFEIAMEQAGCAPHQFLHIGDSLEDDIAGAKGVGALSVWLNRDGRPNTTGIVPDHMVASLHDVVRLLGT